ncbi:O-methyltransferase [Rhizobium puerariae]|uniref:O-methyltransferase n=1 Tax=Rhizobium puerariae TaxID=1585791 RepID=A0ABV6AH69_9HYPH
MSGASIPYHLRPHKAVDRRLFLDLLNRIERWSPLKDFVYASMGAYPLEDHKLVHRLLGVTRLIAFDMDDEVVLRQNFNRPVETCRCMTKKSTDLISDFDNILSECGFADANGAIIWLDYTNPRQLGHQIREFESLLNKLAPGDIVRVTVNAHANDFSDPQAPGAKPPLASEKMQTQFNNLKSRIGEFLPSSASPNDMTPEGLARTISLSFAGAALKALPVSGKNEFCPLSIIRYADGEQMLSITGIIIAREKRQQLLENIDLASWPFSSNGWEDIHRLVVPALTLRERLFFERGIVSKTHQEMISEVGFKSAAGVAVEEFLDSYKKYYRFYPTLMAAEI